MRKGSVELNFTSKKELSLVHLTSARYKEKSCICKFVVLKFDKIIFLKNKLFIKKDCTFDEMFKLIIYNKVNVSVYITTLSLSL